MDGMIEKGPAQSAGNGDLRENLDRLAAILGSHAALHRNLLKIMEEKKSAMAHVRLGELEEAMGAERSAIEAIAASERDRIEATDEVARILGFPPDQRMRLLDLVSRVGEDRRDAFLDLRDDLREIADDMDRLNRLNRTLALHSLENVHLFLSQPGGADLDGKIFTKSGGEGGNSESIDFIGPPR